MHSRSAVRPARAAAVARPSRGHYVGSRRYGVGMEPTRITDEYMRRHTGVILDQVRDGREFEITVRGLVVARLEPLDRTPLDAICDSVSEQPRD